jgi:hypothetical protein
MREWVEATMRHAILTLAVALFVFCIPASPQSESAPRKAASLESGQQYFPVGAFEENPKLSAYKERWYSSYLAAMDEPSLFGAAKGSDITTYRFLLVWQSRALSVRLAVHADGTGVLYGKLVILHSDNPNVSFSKDSVPVSKEEVQHFLMLEQQANFWSMKTVEKNDKNRYGMDGTQWILEGVKDFNYHVVDRWTPKEGDYKQICSYLLELSPVKLDDDTRKK